MTIRFQESTQFKYLKQSVFVNLYSFVPLWKLKMLMGCRLTIPISKAPAGPPSFYSFTFCILRFRGFFSHNQPAVNSEP